MATTRVKHGKCHRCGIEGDFDIVAANDDGIGYCFALECPACGYLVPEQAWGRYQKTGDVVIKRER